jgi:MerR family transcriptional regulator, light-induced transcriptional regulator
VGAETTAPSSLEAAQPDYLAALLAADLSGARSVLDEAVAGGASVRAIYLEVLQPTLYEIGSMWSRAEISVAQEHLATAATQSAMARLAGTLTAGPHGTRPGVAIVACVSDEMHSLGGRMVADFLQSDGWDVQYLGQVTPADDLAALAARHGAKVVALSAALPERIPRVREVVAALRALDPPPFVLCGGQAFGGSEERALATGADAFARDADAASRVLRERFPARA